MSKRDRAPTEAGVRHVARLLQLTLPVRRPHGLADSQPTQTMSRMSERSPVY